MSPTDTGVSEEILDLAYETMGMFDGNGDIRGRLTAALNAIAPRLKAKGMREAAATFRLHTEIDDEISDLLETMASELEARADALSPPVKET